MITNFDTLGRIISASHFFLQKSRVSNPSNIFFNGAMATKKYRLSGFKEEHWISLM